MRPALPARVGEDGLTREEHVVLAEAQDALRRLNRMLARRGSERRYAALVAKVPPVVFAEPPAGEVA